jgi:hypothetical protein
MTNETKSIVCPECGGQGGIDAATFGDRGWHSCYRCGETGRITETAAGRRRRFLANYRDGGYGFKSATPFMIFVGHDESPDLIRVGSAFTLRWAFHLADRLTHEGEYARVWRDDGLGRLTAVYRPNAAHDAPIAPADRADDDETLPF